MIALKCKDCLKLWYTASDRTNLICDDCGGELVKTDSNPDYPQKENKAKNKEGGKSDIISFEI